MEKQVDFDKYSKFVDAVTSDESKDNREHLIIELGDIIWYATNACMALGISFEDVVARNVEKLEKRYPGGQFDVYYSENREDGDL